MEPSVNKPFLFAVVRDLQRDTATSDPGCCEASFYSLSCETYSGTWPQGPRRRPPRRPLNSFYSLSCETYSGTGGLPEACHVRVRVSIRCRARTYSGTLPRFAGVSPGRCRSLARTFD